MQFKTVYYKMHKVRGNFQHRCVSNIPLLLFEDVPQSSDLTAWGLSLQHLDTFFLLWDPDQGAKHFSVTSVKEGNRITLNKTCNTWAGRNLKKTAKSMWNTKQEKNLTFSWGGGVLSCQKSLFFFKIRKLRWTAMCPLLCICYMVVFHGAESEGTKSLWGTDSPFNLQKLIMFSIMARSCWSAGMHSVN